MNFQYATRAQKTTSNWSQGIWLGRCPQSDEHYIADGEEVFRSRTIRRLNRTDRYNKELLEKVVATPWATTGVGKQPTPEWVLKGLPKTAGEEKDEEDTNESKETSGMDIDGDQEQQRSGMTVDSGTTLPSGIGEKRDEQSVELSSGSSSKLRKVQTVSSTTISPVETVATKRGQKVSVETNEED